MSVDHVTPHRSPIMYSNELSNNPFINDPSNPHTRFPEITSDQQYSLPAYQQNPYPPNTPVVVGPHQTGLPFQPSSSFGQQLLGQVSQVNSAPTGYGNSPYGSSYGYLDPQPLQQQPTQLPPHLSEFDPFSAISQGWEGQTLPQQSQPQPIITTSSPSGQPHPRDYVRSHKAELESWDGYAWKQVLNAFDALKEAWEGRKKELEVRIAQVQMYGWQAQPEIARLQTVSNVTRVASQADLLLPMNQLLKDASSNSGTIALFSALSSYLNTFV
jgi:hypothetical protein